MLKNYYVSPKAGSPYTLRNVSLTLGEGALIFKSDKVGPPKAVIPISEVYGVFDDEALKEIDQDLQSSPRA